MKIIDERRIQTKKNKTKQTNNDRKEQGVTEAIVKEWELNAFVAHLS